IAVADQNLWPSIVLCGNRVNLFRGQSKGSKVLLGPAQNLAVLTQGNGRVDHALLIAAVASIELEVLAFIDDMEGRDEQILALVCRMIDDKGRSQAVALLRIEVGTFGMQLIGREQELLASVRRAAKDQQASE